MTVTSALPDNADDFWKHPPMKHNGDVNVDAIFREVGYALTIWEGIEFSFVSLFCHFIEPRISNAAARAYGAISSSQGRMEALDKAAEVKGTKRKVSTSITKSPGCWRNCALNSPNPDHATPTTTRWQNPRMARWRGGAQASGLRADPATVCQNGQRVLCGLP